MSCEISVPEHSLFCKPCGGLLTASSGTGDDVLCRICGHNTPLSALTPPVGEIAASLDLKRSDLLRRLYSRNAKTATDAKEAVVDEECPKCKRSGLSYRTAQLRGLDEGQTIFYTCLNSGCGHKFNINS